MKQVVGKMKDIRGSANILLSLYEEFLGRVIFIRAQWRETLLGWWPSATMKHLGHECGKAIIRILQ